MTAARRSPLPWALLAIQLALIVGLGPRGAAMPGDNSIETFAVKGTRAEADYALLTGHFKAPELFVVVLHYPPGGPHDAEAAAVFDRFAALPGITHRLTLADLFSDAPPDTLPPPPIPLRDAAAGRYIGYFEPAAGATRDATMRAVLDLRDALPGQGALQAVTVAGEPVVNCYLNQASLEVKLRFFPLLILVTLLLIGGLFRNLRVAVVTALGVGGSLACTTGLMAAAGETMNLVTNLIPALIFVLSVAMQVHVLLSIAARGDIVAGVRAKLKPNALIALTTSIGFGSLMTSQVVPIAVMGKYMAAGIWIIFAWAHLVHLGLSRIWHLRVPMPRLGGVLRILHHPAYEPLIHRRGLWLPALLIVLGGAWALRTSPTESNGLHYFKADHPLRVHTDTLERQVTGGSQVDVLLAAPQALEEGDVYLPEDLDPHALERDLRAVSGVRHLISLTALGDFNDACEEADLFPEIDDHLPAPFLSPAYYRIQLLVNALDREAYTRLRADLTAVLAAHGRTTGVHVTGVLDRVMEIQSYLLGSLLRSLALTAAAVVVLLLLLLGRRTRLSALVLPNLFPLGVMALTARLLGMPTTISSVMVFSVAFGIAVDDTIHLVHGYAKRSGDHRERWRRTLADDAPAVTLTTVVLTLGFLVLATSSFLPTLHFGLLLGIGMVAAWVGDLFLLPGMLRPRQKTEPNA